MTIVNRGHTVPMAHTTDTHVLGVSGSTNVLFSDKETFLEPCG